VRAVEGRDPICRKCGGSGRIGPNRAICQSCWMYGVKASWLDDDHHRDARNRAAEDSENEESDDADPAARAAVLVACAKCEIDRRCPSCPWGLLLV